MACRRSAVRSRSGPPVSPRSSSRTRFSQSDGHGPGSPLFEELWTPEAARRFRSCDEKNEEFELIDANTRRQALEDGVLVDLGALAKEAGFRRPVAVTRAAYDGVLRPSEALQGEGQSLAGRAWDMLAVLCMEARRGGGGCEVRFAPLFVMEPGRPSRPVRLKAVSGPGDDGEPVITVMLPDED